MAFYTLLYLVIGRVMSKPAFGIVKDRTNLINGVVSYVKEGGAITEIPNDVAKAKKLEEISRVLFYPAQHKFYAKNTGLSLGRIRELSKSMKDINDTEINAMWAFIQSRK